MRPCLLALVLTPCLAAVASPAWAALLFGRITPTVPEVEAHAASSEVDVSADGKVFVFASSADNWIPGSPMGSKIIVADLVANSVENVARNTAGAALSGNNFQPVASHDGRYIAFFTQSGNLGFAVPTSGEQVVRKDRLSGELKLVSANGAGAAANSGTGGQAEEPSISGDGRFVAFRSNASNLVAGDRPDTEDVFVKNLDDGSIEVVSVETDGDFPAAGTLNSTSHSISADGRFVVFQSTSGNIVAGVGSNLGLVYVRDVALNSTEIASRATNGDIANSQSELGAISPNGRFVSFRSFASNLGTGSGTRVFVRDRNNNSTTRVPFPSVGGTTATGCRESDVSDTGTVILACALPNNPNTTTTTPQVFLHVPGAIGSPFLISSDTADVRGNQESGRSLAINASGLSMAFESLATNLVANDTNGVTDVFVLYESSLRDGVFADGFEDE